MRQIMETASKTAVGMLSVAGLVLFLVPASAQDAGTPATKSVIRVRPDPPRNSAGPTAGPGIRVVPKPGAASRPSAATARSQRSQESTIEEGPSLAPPEQLGEEIVGETIEGPPIPPGYMLELDDGAMPSTFFPGGACDACGGVGCTHCGFVGGVLRGWYVRGEYLSWRTTGMDVPALVTTSPGDTASRAAGVLGQPGTTILFGNDSLNADQRSGGRVYLGFVLDSDQRLTAEGEYFSLNDATSDFTASSTGNTILARPFFNMLAQQPGGGTLPQESSELIAFPNRVGGTGSVSAVTQFEGAAARLRYLLCCSDACLPGICGFGPVMGGYRMELTGGFRFLRLDDSLLITENLNVVPTGTIDLFDQFQTQNEFAGGEVGMQLQTRRGRWSMDLMSRVAVGNTRGTVDISGQTTTNNGRVTTSSGGLLALDSNIGNYQQDQLAVVPELALNLGYDLSPHWRVLVGYTFIYWSRVLRAGQQIDRDIDPNQIPPPPNAPVILPARPGFEFYWTDFWAQGLSVGLEGKW